MIMSNGQKVYPRCKNYPLENHYSLKIRHNLRHKDHVYMKNKSKLYMAKVVSNYLKSAA